MRRIGIELHGVRLNLSSNYDLQLEYLEHILGPDVRPVWESPDLEVHGTWTDGTGGPAVEDSGPPGDGASSGFGKRMSLTDNGLVWFDTHRDKDMQLRFRREGAATIFEVDYCYHPSAKKLAKFPDYLQRKFFTLARYLVHFPIAWHLGRTRGWFLVHASAAASRDEAVLVAGPGGAGKTTTCVGLMGRPGVRLVTENLLFTDGVHVFPLIEPIRLTDDSLGLLNERQLQALRPLGVEGGSKHKSLFQLPHDSSDRPARAAALFIPQFSEPGFLRPIAPEVASELLAASNRLTLELNDFDWYVAALDLLWPQPGHAARQVRTLERLTANMSCYALGIDRSKGVDAVVDRVLECVGWAQPAMRGSAS